MLFALHSIGMESLKLFGTAAILAGGKSSRFGSNKALALWQGNSLMEVIITQLMPYFEDIVIISNSPEIYSDYPVRHAEDLLKQKGPLGGIHAALSVSLSEYVFILACDMPYLSEGLIEYMKRGIRKKLPGAATACRGDFLEPFHGFYSRSLIPEIETSVHRGSGSVFSLLQRPDILKIDDNTVRKYSPDGRIFFNVNHPEDMSVEG